jgi:hypothetical protein
MNDTEEVYKNGIKFHVNDEPCWDVEKMGFRLFDPRNSLDARLIELDHHCRRNTPAYAFDYFRWHLARSRNVEAMSLAYIFADADVEVLINPFFDKPGPTSEPQEEMDFITSFSGLTGDDVTRIKGSLDIHQALTGQLPWTCVFRSDEAFKESEKKHLNSLLESKLGQEREYEDELSLVARTEWNLSKESVLQYLKCRDAYLIARGRL